jgi:hypothetical protein
MRKNVAFFVTCLTGQELVHFRWKRISLIPLSPKWAFHGKSNRVGHNRFCLKKLSLINSIISNWDGVGVCVSRWCNEKIHLNAHTHTLGHSVPNSLYNRIWSYFLSKTRLNSEIISKGKCKASDLIPGIPFGNCLLIQSLNFDYTTEHESEGEKEFRQLDLSGIGRELIPQFSTSRNRVYSQNASSEI